MEKVYQGRDTFGYVSLSYTLLEVGKILIGQ